MTDKVSRLPEPGVVLDLDIEEKPEQDVKPPFIVKVGERNLEFSDPSDIDWRDLAAIEAPGELLRLSLSREDHEFLRKQSLPTWKFNRLMEAYNLHFDLEDKIREAKRRSALG